MVTELVSKMPCCYLLWCLCGDQCGGRDDPLCLMSKDIVAEHTLGEISFSRSSKIDAKVAIGGYALLIVIYFSHTWDCSRFSKLHAILK